MWLEQQPGTQEEKAQRLGVSRRTIIRWLDGTAAPDRAKRREMRDAGGPPEIDWDTMYEAGRARGDVAPLEPGPANANTARAAADQVYALVLEEISAMRDGTDGESPQKRAARLERLTRNMVALGKMTGAADLDEVRIAASPPFRRMADRLADALAPWPDALAAATAALEAAP